MFSLPSCWTRTQVEGLEQAWCWHQDAGVVIGFTDEGDTIAQMEGQRIVLDLDLEEAAAQLQSELEAPVPHVEPEVRRCPNGRPCAAGDTCAEGTCAQEEANEEVQENWGVESDSASFDDPGLGDVIDTFMLDDVVDESGEGAVSSFLDEEDDAFWQDAGFPEDDGEGFVFVGDDFDPVDSPLDSFDDEPVVSGPPLSPDQEAARDAILAALKRIEEDVFKAPSERVMVLTGAAGTGKTTLVRHLVAGVRNRTVVYAAPTGKAASRLSEVTGHPCLTVHSLIYGKPSDEGCCPTCEEWTTSLAVSKVDLAAKGKDKRTCSACGGGFDLDVEVETQLRFKLKGEDSETEIQFGSDALVIIDEASMVDAQMDHDLILSIGQLPGSCLLYVGDPYQLPPVTSPETVSRFGGRVFGPDFDNPTASLMQVHRQALDSNILGLATNLRTKASKYPFDSVQNKLDDVVLHDRATPQDAAEWLAERRKAGADATLITYTNGMRKSLNNLTRKASGAEALGQTRGTGVVVGDRLMILYNNKELGYMNGEVYEVASVEWVPARNKRVFGATSVVVKDKEVLKIRFVGQDDFVYIAEGPFGEDYREFKAFIRPHEKAWDRAVESAQSRNAPPMDEKQARLLEKIKALAADQRGTPEGESAQRKAKEMVDKHVLDSAYGDLLDPRLFLHVDFGEALTCHKSQGSQYEEVGIVWDSSTFGLWFKGKSIMIQGQSVSEGRRWAYTAVTRASKKLNIFMV